jgi:hypothetical protein
MADLALHIVGIQRRDRSAIVDAEYFASERCGLGTEQQSGCAGESQHGGKVRDDCR